MTNADRLAYLAGLVPQICRAHGWDMNKVTTVGIMSIGRKDPFMHIHIDAGEPGELSNYIVTPKDHAPYVVAHGTFMDVSFTAFLPMAAEVTA